MNNNEQNTDGFIPPHDGYRNLKSYLKAEIIFDGTMYFFITFAYSKFIKRV